jgi:hypothetical protein
MLGRDDDVLDALERAHHLYVEVDEVLLAVRCAFWLVINLALRGEMARATDWLGRAQRLVDGQKEECVEEGYLLLPEVLQYSAMGDHLTALETAAKATEIGVRLLQLAHSLAASVRRVLGETTDLLARAGLLASYVEIMLETGALGEARATVDLATGDPNGALMALRRAASGWQVLGAP